MRENARYGLDWKDWIRASNLVDLAGAFLAGGAIQQSQLTFMRHQTLRFRRIEAEISVNEILNGCDSILYLGCVGSRIQAFNARADLSKRNVIEYDVIRRGFAIRGKVKFNLWGILKFLMQAIAKKDIRNKAVEEAESLFSKVDHLWSDQNWKKKEIMPVEAKGKRLNEQIEAGMKKSHASAEKRKMKLDMKEVNASMIRSILKDLCKEYELPFDGVWYERDYGNAKNFVRACNAADEDTREVLKDVIKNWGLISQGAIMTKDRKAVISFSRTFSFREFFQKKEAVIGWLAERRMKPSGKEADAYIDLRPQVAENERKRAEEEKRRKE